MLRRSFSKALANKEPLLCDSSIFSDDTNSDSDNGGSGMVPVKSLPKLRPPRLIAKTCKQYRQRSHDTDGTPLLSDEEDLDDETRTPPASKVVVDQQELSLNLHSQLRPGPS